LLLSPLLRDTLASNDSSSRLSSPAKCRVRQVTSEVVDSRGEYLGHGDIVHGVVVPKGEPLPPAADDAGLLSAAMGDIARARGMTNIAKAAGITREALYKALRPGSAPRFDTVNRVCTALGVRLVVQPLHPA
jgi:probable addiction module antidote protein